MEFSPLPMKAGSSEVEFEPLTDRVVDSACALSAQAGWEQTREDWLRLARLPGGGVWVWIRDGEVRASYSLAAYGKAVAWIGMILVDQEYRGRGLGKAAFAASLKEAAARSFPVLGLDATDLGAPIYRKFDFRDVCPVTRWRGIPGATKARRACAVKMHDGIAEWDRKISGVDRRGLLEDLAASGATILSLEGPGGVRGFGVLRPARTAWFLGPVTAASPADFEDLLNGAAGLCDGRPLICDVLRDHAADYLLEIGLKPVRRLSRMFRPEGGSLLSGDSLWCGAGFELG